MAEIALYRMRAQRMELAKLAEIARQLRIDGKPVETEEALAVTSERQALAYAQPGAKFAGLLFYTDQSSSLARAVEKPLQVEIAQRWTDTFLKQFDLLPQKPEDERIQVALRLQAYPGEGVVFDGKERRRVACTTEIRSDITLNATPVTGPRAKVRMSFKEGEQPVLMHRGLWESLELFDTRELVEAGRIEDVIKDKLSERKGERAYKIVSTRLSYVAGEYQGGPDLLAPYYLVELEFPQPVQRGWPPHGIKQRLQVPAYR